MSTLRSNVRPKKDQSSGVTNKRLIKTLKVIIYTEQVIKIDIHAFTTVGTGFRDDFLFAVHAFFPVFDNI